MKLLQNGNLYRRDFLTRTVPACSLACLGAANLLAITGTEEKKPTPDEPRKYPDRTGGPVVKEMIGYCGYACHLCAARSDDVRVRQDLVNGWRRIFGHEMYTAENVRCDGCPSDGRIADQTCKARPCARERGVENCAYCDEFPCAKIKNLMASRESMLIWHRPSDGPITEQEYNLCMRQFDSMSRIVRALASAGKLDSWVVAAVEEETDPDGSST